MSERLPSPYDVAQALRDYHVPKQDTDDLLELAGMFVTLKRKLGHRYEAPARRLYAFLHFLHERGVRNVGDLTVQGVLAWAEERSRVDRKTWLGELSALSVFFDHLVSLGKIKNNLTVFLARPVYRSRVRPYIYSSEELRLIFHPPGASQGRRLRAFVYFVTYALGLRLSEPLKLRMRHIDPAKGTVLIERSKFGKDRLLPLHPKVQTLLDHHIRERRSQAGPDEPLFANLRGKSWSIRHFSIFFMNDLRRLGLYRPSREEGGVRILSTRAHGLRHTFAVNRLLKWYREGADVQAMLPFLSTFMGHAEVRYTQVYLTVTGLVLGEAAKRFQGHWEKHFPLKP